MSNLTTNATKVASKTLALSTIALKDSSELTLVRESLGTLFSIFGKDANVEIHNIRGKKRVFLTVTNSQGQGQNFTLSERLSELVRDKEVPITDVMFNPITLETTAPNPETKEYDENYVKSEYYCINVESEKFNLNVGEKQARKPKSLADYVALS